MAASRRQTTESEHTDAPVLLDLRLAEGTPGEAFERVARAIDSGQLTIPQGKAAAEILERRLRILDAEKFRQRLELAEARALEATRRAGAHPTPASRALVEVNPEVSRETSMSEVP